METAVLRAVRTGTAQAAGNMSLQSMIEHDWDLIRVSAHIGARYGDGGENPGNHFWWQGKLYSRTGRDKKYPPFVETTGYGTGEGLCGWNCRHSFEPGDPNHNPFKDFDAEENKRVYDLSQKQRKMERNIRHTKNKLIALREGIDAADNAGVKANLEAEYNRVSKLLGRQNQAYNDFCKENGLKRLPDRLQTARCSREDARRSMSAANSGGNSAPKNGVANERERGIMQEISQKPDGTYIMTEHEITEASIQKVPAIQPEGWSSQESARLREAHQDLLRFIQEAPVGTEAAAVYALDMTPITKVTGEEGRVRIPQSDIPHIAMHNHPDGLIFSPNDIVQFAMRDKTIIATAVGNNGAVYLMKKLDYYSLPEFAYALGMLKQELAEIFKEGNPLKYIEAIDQFLKGAEKYGVRFITGTP